MLTAAIAPFLVAVVQEATSPSSAFYLMAAIVALSALLVPQTLPRRCGIPPAGVA
jgi:hypothetical protein